MEFLISIILLINFPKVLFLNVKNEKGIVKKILSFTKNVFSYDYELYEIGNIDKHNQNDENTSNFILKNLVTVLNVFPLILNNFIHQKLLKIPVVLFPNRLSLVTFTLFLNNLNRQNQCTNIYMLISIFCYSYLLVNFAYEFYMGDVSSPANLCSLILNFLNIFIVYYLNICFTKNITESNDSFLI
jgi:hypothetical protein